MTARLRVEGETVISAARWMRAPTESRPSTRIWPWRQTSTSLRTSISDGSSRPASALDACFASCARRRCARRRERRWAALGITIPSLSVEAKSLSGGQRQGIAIARAAKWSSRVVILDEPTAALGVQETAKVEEMIRGLAERGLTIILVTHRLDQVFRLADRVAVLRRGRLVGDTADGETTATRW